MATLQQGMLKEYPFIWIYAQNVYGLSMTVQRIDADLLKRPNRVFKRVEYDFEVWDNYKFFMLDQSGNLLGRVGFLKAEKNPDRRWYQFWKPELVPTTGVATHLIELQKVEYVGEALARMRDVLENIHYILEVAPEAVVLHKLPKGLTMPEWLKRVEEDSQQKLCEKIEQIDSV